MKNIESLKNYVGNVTEEDFMILATKIYMITDFICDDYPKHKEWYFTKQLPATINGDERNILFVRNPEDDNEIISMACLKRDEEETKMPVEVKERLWVNILKQITFTVTVPCHLEDTIFRYCHNLNCFLYGFRGFVKWFTCFFQFLKSICK